MFDYDYAQADYDLDEIKEKLYAYLVKCQYDTGKTPEEEATRTFKYVESLVDKTIKRQRLDIRFGGGGSPLWYSTIMKYLSQWIAA